MSTSSSAGGGGAGWSAAYFDKISAASFQGASRCACVCLKLMAFVSCSCWNNIRVNLARGRSLHDLIRDVPAAAPRAA
eukprot:6645369-Pyramimonas_sp.AAC.1